MGCGISAFLQFSTSVTSRLFPSSRIELFRWAVFSNIGLFEKWVSLKWCWCVACERVVCFEEGSQEADGFSAGDWRDLPLSLELWIDGVLLSDPRSSSTSARRSYQTQTHLLLLCTHTNACTTTVLILWTTMRINQTHINKHFHLEM